MPKLITQQKSQQEEMRKINKISKYTRWVSSANLSNCLSRNLPL